VTGSFNGGRVGTGFTEAVTRELWTKLQPLRTDAPFFAEKAPEPPPQGGVIWVRPALVAEIDLRGWTSDDLVRHASFKGLRDDKDPREVVRERT
jgi:bifunctional non-homologous end joining protein LigD